MTDRRTAMIDCWTAICCTAMIYRWTADDRWMADDRCTAMIDRSFDGDFGSLDGD
jgi:hypothetical protein